MATETIYKYGTSTYFTAAAKAVYEAAYSVTTQPVVATVRTVTIKVIDGTRGDMWFDQQGDGLNSSVTTYENGVQKTYAETNKADTTVVMKHYFVGGNRVEVFGTHPTCDFCGTAISSSGNPTGLRAPSKCSANGCVVVRPYNASSSIIINKVYGNRMFEEGNYDTLPTYLKSGTEYDANKIVYDNTNGRIWFGLNVSLDKTFVVHVGYHHWLAISNNGGSGTVNNNTQTVNSSKNYLSITDVDTYNQSGASSSYAIRSSKGGTFPCFQIVRQGMGAYYPSETRLRAIEGLTPPEGLIFKGVNTKADGTGTRYVEGSDLSGLLTRLTRGNNSYETRVLLYAEWGERNTTITRTGEAAGTLQLRSSEDNFTEVLAESVDGVLRYETKSGVTYRVSCVLTSEEAVLYTATGVNGAAVYDFAGGSDVSLEYVVSLKTLYQIELAAGDHGTLSIKSPAAPDRTEDGKNYYVTGRSITVLTTPGDAYSVTAAYIDEILSGGGYSQIQEVPASAFTDGAFTIKNLSKSIRIRAAYEAKTCSVSATIDAASASAISAVSVSASTVEYGDPVTFNAVVETGYSFDGWYLNGERIVGAGAEYTVEEVTSDLALVAKAKCAVALAVEGGDDTVSLEADGAAYTEPVEVVLGGSVDIAVRFAEGSEYQFDHWTKREGSGAPALVALLAEATITPTTGVTYTATVAREVSKVLKVHLLETGVPPTVLDSGGHPGAITIADATPEQADGAITIADATPEQADGAITIGPEYGTGDDSPSPYEHTRIGMGYVRVTAQPSITVGGMTKSFNRFAVTNVDHSGETITKNLAFTTLLAAAETEIDAFYGEASRVTVSVGYANGSSGRCGEIAITGFTDPDAVRNPDGSVTSLQGSELTLEAIPANGWKFDGWFDVPDMGVVPVAPGNKYVVVAEQTLYARFVENKTHAVCQWEGSDENKVMTWRSKTYAASKPFNPSACRVDALGYPPSRLVELTVDMFSAPDAKAKPTASTTLTNIASQDARRLPVRRMERYMQIEVKANVEVDALLVGTSMEGLAV